MHTALSSMASSLSVFFSEVYLFYWIVGFPSFILPICPVERWMILQTDSRTARVVQALCVQIYYRNEASTGETRMPEVFIMRNQKLAWIVLRVQLLLTIVRAIARPYVRCKIRYGKNMMSISSQMLPPI